MGISSGCESRFCSLLADLYLCSFVEVGWRLEVCCGDVGGNESFCAVGKHDSELLDPHARLRVPAVSGRRKQSDEHRRVAPGGGDGQTLPAKKSPPLRGAFATKPRRLRI